MKPLIKLVLMMLVFFSLMFVVFHSFGVLQFEQIKATLIKLQTISPWWVFSAVVFLLWVDLFIAVPTLSITILAGFFLGNMYGFLTASIGLMSAGTTGYFLSKRYGHKILHKIISKESERKEIESTFSSHGIAMIVLSRAMPILPEVTSCLAGLTKLPFLKFILAWAAGSLPYAFIASYAGSIITLSDPKPAILIGISIPLTLWLGWFIFSKKLKKIKSK